jgi:hypothetical protein
VRAECADVADASCQRCAYDGSTQTSGYLQSGTPAWRARGTCLHTRAQRITAAARATCARSARHAWWPLRVCLPIACGALPAAANTQRAAALTAAGFQCTATALDTLYMHTRGAGACRWRRARTLRPKLSAHPPLLRYHFAWRAGAGTKELSPPPLHRHGRHCRLTRSCRRADAPPGQRRRRRRPAAARGAPAPPPGPPAPRQWCRRP